MSGQGDKWIPPPPTHRVLFRHHLILLVTAEPPEPGPLFLGITGGTLSILPHEPCSKPAPVCAGWSRHIPAPASRAAQTAGAEDHLCHQEMFPHSHSTVWAITVVLRRWLRMQCQGQLLHAEIHLPSLGTTRLPGQGQQGRVGRAGPAGQQ